jgi:hypothetical protein
MSRRRELEEPPNTAEIEFTLRGNAFPNGLVSTPDLRGEAVLKHDVFTFWATPLPRVSELAAFMAFTFSIASIISDTSTGDYTG